MSIKNAVEIQNLSKSFKTGLKKRFQALNNLSLTIKENEIFGYLGANGTGKTTTFKLMLGLIFPDTGDIKFWGVSFQDVKTRANIGYLPENPYFYSYLTGQESLNVTASMFDMKSNIKKERINEMLDLVNLQHAKDIQLRKYSRGMLQRLGIAQALVHDPKLLILDEPMSGLDPMGRKDMRNIILSCKDQGKTVLFSSHIISDVEMICDRASILSNGVLKKIITVDDIMDRDSNGWEITFKGNADTIESINSKNENFILKQLSAKDIFLLKAIDKKIAFEILNIIQKQGAELLSFVPLRISLEEIYIATTLKKDQ